MSADCPATLPGDTAQCLTAPITSGSGYALSVAPSGDGTCDGACNFNRYTLTMSLGPP
jgi:hypothetical protein